MRVAYECILLLHKRKLSQPGSLPHSCGLEAPPRSLTHSLTHSSTSRLHPLSTAQLTKNDSISLTKYAYFILYTTKRAKYEGGKRQNYLSSCIRTILSLASARLACAFPRLGGAQTVRELPKAVASSLTVAHTEARNLGKRSEKTLEKDPSSLRSSPFTGTVFH